MLLLLLLLPPPRLLHSLLPAARVSALAVLMCTPVPLLRCPQVRANSLQELVYKQGQAGITKATVSIVFDNREKERGPVRAAGGAGRACRACRVVQRKRSEWQQLHGSTEKAWQTVLLRDLRWRALTQQLGAAAAPTVPRLATRRWMRSRSRASW